MRPADAGFTVVESLVALTLGLLLLALAGRTLADLRGGLARVERAAERLATVRMTREVLGAEAREGGVTAAGTDTIAVRAYRGVAFVCPAAPGAEVLLVRGRGIRRPDPAKDSVALLLAGGGWVARELREAEAGRWRCPGAEPIASERWTLGAPAPEVVVLARWFESGSFHLVGRALRYRRGAAGRQPLTPARLRTPGSRFAGGGAALEAVLDFGDGGAAWRVGLGSGG